MNPIGKGYDEIDTFEMPDHANQGKLCYFTTKKEERKVNIIITNQGQKYFPYRSEMIPYTHLSLYPRSNLQYILR